MSDFPADYAERLNLREQIVRIDHAIAETHKFQAETSKLSRERAWYPAQIGIAFMAAGGALVGGTVALMRLLGP